MYFHASQTEGITVLEPRISNHNIPLIYFSSKRENVLVYLSNAVEKYCREKHFPYNGVWSKWGPYGFDSDGILRYEEYYPNALEETYDGVNGYIYSCEEIEAERQFELNIPYAFVTGRETEAAHCEYVENALEEILKAEKHGLIRIVRYNDFIKKREEWLKKIIQTEYNKAFNHPEYQFFLKEKFAAYLDI